MNYSKINPEDIQLLCKLFKLPNEVLVYDPSSSLKSSNFCVINDIAKLLKKGKKYKVCVNLSDKPMEVLPFDFLIEFGNKNRVYKTFHSERFFSLNNRDGSFRWIQPSKLEYPLFLNLYNGSGIKANVYKVAAKLAFRLGLKARFCNDMFTLHSKETMYFEKLYTTKDIAIFTGTIGENRKAVAAICNNGKATTFIKIPISDKANALIQKEQEHLENLESKVFETMEIPTAEWTKTGLALKNVQPDSAFNRTELGDQHLKAQVELFSKTRQEKMLSNVSIYQELGTLFQSIKSQGNNQILQVKVNKLIGHLETLMQAFDKEKIIPVAFAHGDFTPWNMFASKNKVHVYDWELAMPEQRAFYDLFHFIFQSGILVLHEPFQKIKAKVRALEKNPLIQEMIKEQGLNFWCCYRWYLLCNCTYYLELYSRQEQLHKQVDWLIDCWIEATGDAIKMPLSTTADNQNMYL